MFRIYLRSVTTGLLPPPLPPPPPPPAIPAHGGQILKRYLTLLLIKNFLRGYHLHFSLQVLSVYCYITSHFFFFQNVTFSFSFVAGYYRSPMFQKYLKAQSIFFTARVPSMANVPLMFYILMLHSSLGYPSGAPADKCETMGPPEHGAFAQTVNPPFTITTSSNRYKCGESVLGNFTL